MDIVDDGGPVDDGPGPRADMDLPDMEMPVDMPVPVDLPADLCANGVRDPGEDGVDCGGDCVRCVGPTGVEGMVLWLRPDGYTEATGTWTDSGPQGYSFTMAVGAEAPTLGDTRPELSGARAVAFEPEARLMTDRPVTLGSEVTIFFVLAKRTARGILLEASAASSGNDGAFLDVFNSAGKLESQTGRDSSLVSWRSDAVPLAEWHWLATFRGGPEAPVRIAIDGATSGAIAVDGAAPALTDHIWYLGGRQGTPSYDGFAGEIAEIIVYDHALDAEEFAHISGYIDSRYSF